MTPLVPEKRRLAPSLEVAFRPIAAELAEVERMLQAELRSRFPFVDELVRYGCLLGGKRLRPGLVLLAAKATGELRPAHLTLALVMELIHTATLVHDDVLDEAVTRRHLATVNCRWDNEASILLGDYLFTHAYCLICAVNDPFAYREIGLATNRVCEGELRQKGSRGDFQLSEAEYLEIIEAKTAELYACSCRLGAHFAEGDEPAVRQLAAYGRYLGIAFQIADDLLDVWGNEKTTGKSLGTDLKKRKPTLPLIRVLQLIAGPDREELLRNLESDPPLRRELLTPYFERYEAFAYARDKALHYARRARQELDGLPPSPALDSLHQITDFVVARSA